MARTGTLLTADERKNFGRWLSLRVKNSGVSKSTLSKDCLGADSTQRLNRYLTGAKVPTLPVLTEIIGAIGGSLVIALWRAGYFREMLILLDSLSQIDETRDDAITLAMCAFPSGGMKEASSLAVHFAIETNDSVRRALDEDSWWVDAVKNADIRRRLHPLLRRAADELAFVDVEPHTRRLAAAVYVNAWADKVAPDSANRARQTNREAESFTESLKGQSLEAVLSQQTINGHKERAR